MQLLVIVKVGGLSFPKRYELHMRPSNFFQELPSKFDTISMLEVVFKAFLQLTSVYSIYRIIGCPAPVFCNVSE